MIVFECGACRTLRPYVAWNGSRIMRCLYCLCGMMNCPGYRYCTGRYRVRPQGLVFCRVCHLPIFRNGLLCMPSPQCCPTHGVPLFP